MGVGTGWSARLSGPLAFSDSRIYPSTSARKPSKPGPGGPDSSPPDPWKPSLFIRMVVDFSPGLEGRVGDQFGRPQGVQVKASNS